MAQEVSRHLLIARLAFFCREGLQYEILCSLSQLVFNELSDLVASQVEDLHLNGDPTLTDFEMVKASRSKLRDLSSRMVRYTLSMSSNDCGGITEYSGNERNESSNDLEFFTSLREVFGISELRDELSNELKDVLALLESHYLEEEKRQRL